MIFHAKRQDVLQKVTTCKLNSASDMNGKHLRACPAMYIMIMHYSGSEAFLRRNETPNVYCLKAKDQTTTATDSATAQDAIKAGTENTLNAALATPGGAGVGGDGVAVVLLVALLLVALLSFAVPVPAFVGDVTGVGKLAGDGEAAGDGEVAGDGLGFDALVLLFCDVNRLRLAPVKSHVG